MNHEAFVILRHARNQNDHLLGVRCYQSIVQNYPKHPIFIIDDNSILRDFSDFTNAQIIETHPNLHGAGEILPWYFTFHLHLANRVFVLHDSMSITTNRFDFTSNQFLWTFESSHFLGAYCEYHKIQKLKGIQWEDMVEQNHWKGCFGCCAILDFDTLQKCHSTFGLFDLSFVEQFKTRTDRMGFERIFGYCMSMSGVNKSLMNDIHCYPSAFIPVPDEFLEQVLSVHHSPVIKIWRGR